jgi:hypothetical protein
VINVHKSPKNVIINGWTNYSHKIMAFWDTIWCAMVDRCQCFRGNFCLYLINGRCGSRYLQNVGRSHVSKLQSDIVTMRTSNLTKLEPLGSNKYDWIIRECVVLYKVLWQYASHYIANWDRFNMYNISGIRPISVLMYVLLYWYILLLVSITRLVAHITT